LSTQPKLQYKLISNEVAGNVLAGPTTCQSARAGSAAHGMAQSAARASSAAVREARRTPPYTGANSSQKARMHGLTLAHFTAQLEDLRDTSLTLELKLSSFGTYPRVHVAYVRDGVRLS